MRQTLKSIMHQNIVVCNNKLRWVETKGTDKEREGGAREGKEKGESGTGESNGRMRKSHMRERRKKACQGKTCMALLMSSSTIAL